MDYPLSSVIDNFKRNQQYYLATFGGFVNQNINRILLRRHPKLLKISEAPNKLITLFQNTFCDFVIENPEHFTTQIKYPYIDSLLSLKELAANPDKYNIIWIKEGVFLDFEYAKSTIILNPNTQFNTLKSNRRYKIDFERKQYSERQVALAMMDAFDPDTFSIQSNWTDYIEIRKTKQQNKREQWLNRISDMLSTRMLSKAMKIENPSAHCLNDTDTYASPKLAMTKPNWDEHIKYAIRLFFNHLNITHYKDALDCYIKLTLNTQGGFFLSDHEIKVNGVPVREAMTQANDWLQEVIKNYKMPAIIKHSDFKKQFIIGVKRQLLDTSRKNIAYNKSFCFVDTYMKKFKRMSICQDYLAEYETLLFNESLLFQYSNKKATSSTYDFCIALNTMGARSDETIAILNNLIPSLGRMAKIVNKEDSTLELDATFIDDYLKKTLPTIMRHIKSEGAKNLQATINALLHNFVLHLSPDIPSYTETLIESRIGVEKFIIDNDIDCFKSCIMRFSTNNSQSIMHLLLITFDLCSAKSSYVQFKCLLDIVITQLNLIMQGTKTSLIFSNFSHLISQFFIPSYIDCLRQQKYSEFFAIATLKYKITSTEDEASSAIGNFAYTDLFDEIESIQNTSLKNKLLTSVFSLFLSAERIPSRLIAMIEDNLSNFIKNITESDPEALKNMLNLYFKKENIEPYDYMLDCPDWHQPTVIEILS